MKALVLDTSVIIKWFSEYNEADLDRALKLRTDILTGKCSITVPDLLFYELANALRHNSRFTAKDVTDAINSLIEMAFDIRAIEKHIMEIAIEIAFKFNVTVYDSYFLALSKIEKKPFITADYKFAERIKGFKNVVKLKEM